MIEHLQSFKSRLIAHVLILCTGTPNFHGQGNLHSVPLHLPITAHGLQAPLFRAPSTQPNAQLQPAQRPSTHPERDQRNPTKPKHEVKNKPRAEKLQSQISALQSKMSSKRGLVEEAGKILHKEKESGELLDKKDRKDCLRIMVIHRCNQKQLAKLEKDLRIARLQGS